MLDWLKNSQDKIIKDTDNIKIIKGDLISLAIDGKFDVIVHGCNCFCIMGAGIAKQIADKFPQAYLADAQTREGDRNKLGNYTATAHKGRNKNFIILNAYTQYNLGKDFNRNAFEDICIKLNKTYKGLSIGMPWIGCGIGGGIKQDVFKIIKDNLTDCNVTIVEYNGKN
jgi:O-acetyl-ADP-ribose deacetylase (regulator of RNase III)